MPVFGWEEDGDCRGGVGLKIRFQELWERTATAGSHGYDVPRNQKESILPSPVF